MPATKSEILHGWGHYPLAACQSWRPEKHRDLVSIVQENDAMIARGLGRSYGDASLLPEGVIRTERLNHFIEFDTQSGIVHAQAGVTLAELMDIGVPHGWFPYTLPGTRHVTLGGAFACNIHGKNHYRTGDFAEHVLSIRLMLASGESIDCSPDEHSELFWATAGGMGMTGIIEFVTLQLMPIDSSSVSTTTYRVEALADMVAAFEHYRDTSDYMVGWIDHMARGDATGHGVFQAANHASFDEGGSALADFSLHKPNVNVPFFMPIPLLNRYSMALYNRRRFRKYSEWRQAEMVDFSSFFHPLDHIGHWNRLYGKRGFLQYQCLFPDTHDVVEKMQHFLAALHKKKIFSFLAVIKYHRDGQGFITFPQRGYSLALDFPNTPRVRAALPHLDSWLAENGGRVYLAKDALLAPDMFDAMYGQNARDWRAILRSIDPQGKFRSLMSQRLGWKSEPV